ncbi:MAG: hypothetical protein AAGG75_16775 [Bacteroidota bacterium]
MRIRINFQHQLPGFTPQIAYVVDFLHQHPLKPNPIHWTINGEPNPDDVSIHYGNPTSTASYQVPAQGLLFQQSLPDINQLRPSTYLFDATLLHSVEKASGPQRPFFQNGRFGFDWVEMLFFHLSRLEEYHAKEEDWDEWEMMRADRQFLSKHRLHHRPVVDQLVVALYTALGFPPQQFPTRYSLSHDVDVIRKFTTPYQYLRAAGRLLRQGRGWSAQRQLWRGYWKSRSREWQDPYDTFDWLLKSGGKVEKVLYVLAGGVTPYDRFCQIAHPAMAEVLELAQQRGYQVALHPSYAAHREEALFERERGRLETLVGESLRQSRQHFLHFDFRETPQLLERQGILVDSSLGYQDQIGFRCGTGFAYALYHFAEQRAFRFKEKPLIVMDTALLMHTQENVAAFEQQLKQFLEQNREGTQVTFNFHNSTFDPLRLEAAHLKQLYLALLATF